MAGLMDMISNRDSSMDKSIAETTMQCLREMKKQTGENVELVKQINILVEASITKIKGIEAKASKEENNTKEVTEAVRQETEKLKAEIADCFTGFKAQLDEEQEKELGKFYKSLKNLLEEQEERQEHRIKHLNGYLKGILWFLCLIAVLLIASIIGII